MLNKFPELQKKLRPLMDQFADALRTKQNFAESAADGTTFIPNSKLLSRSLESEKETMDMMRDRALTKKKIIDERKRREEEMRKQKWASRMKKKQEQERLKMKMVVSTTTAAPKKVANEPAKELGGFDLPNVGKNRLKQMGLKKFDPDAMIDDEVSLKASPMSANHFEDDEEKAVHHVPEEIPVAHAQAHELSHSQSSYSVVSHHEHSGSRAPYITVAFAGLALMTVMVLAIVILRRRNVSSPQQQGFVEVNQLASPEERHIANMQINGYENPTYKYFEETDT
jgi:amyloid beta A4 protein